MTLEDDIRGFIFKRIIYHLQYKNVLELKIDGEDKGVAKCYTLGERNVISGQKKVEVARGVIELGQILIDTKKKMTRTEFLKWLEDNRVSFQERTSNKYIKIAKEFGEDFGHGMTILDNLSLNKLYTLASATEEVKEDVANSKDLGDSINRGIIDSLSLNKLYTLASAPEEVKEEMGLGEQCSPNSLQAILRGFLFRR